MSPTGNHVKATPYHSFFKRSFIFHPLFKSKKMVIIGLSNIFPVFFMVFLRQIRNEKWSLKIKWITRLLLMKKIFH